MPAYVGSQSACQNSYEVQYITQLAHLAGNVILHWHHKRVPRELPCHVNKMRNQVDFVRMSKGGAF